MPSGVVELPIAFNLKSSETNPLSLSGSILSSLSLQYAGNPAVSLTFLDDPTSCDLSADACLARLDAMNAEIQVGGRYIANQSDTSCSRVEPGTFQQVKTPWFVPLLAEVDNAFRYKTRFKTRSGSTVGFTPQICIPASDAIPYCYDPAVTEEIESRQNCAAAIYINFYESEYLLPETREMLGKYLKQSFSKENITDPWTGEVVPKEGFEFLFAELLIMLGDESYTSAFAARMDLAGSNMVNFEGALFEPSGINLSGGAGYEMYSLYQATQYYQMVLDRFYSLSPLVWGSIERDRLNPGQGFITQATVVTYFDRCSHGILP